MALKWLLNSVFTHTLVHVPDQKQGLTTEKVNLQAKETGVSTFQMPLHYPRYKKADYENMEEWKVDMLLNQYGLGHHVKGSLDTKRKFAMGAFLWPDQL
ncbi:uncharacterized protein LOC110706973 [Chenopodium quinoa]|uniref:DUF7722 domain-containing protein n=1 Tax=Chenopodium quinoa TaxID=63459 RepID=A0A803LQ48_CHEQI|nr:uncharacterized protein LOC110706973 [Chenopodium quinoa]